MQKLTDGLWRWTARHPEWHPGEFGAEVACFAAQAGDTTLLIDPLLPRTSRRYTGPRCNRWHAARPPRHPHHDPVPRAELGGAVEALPEAGGNDHPRPSRLRQAARATSPASARSTPTRSSPAASPPTRSASRAATRRRSTSRATERWSSATRSRSGRGGSWSGRRQGGREGRALLPGALQPDPRAAPGAGRGERARHPRAARSMGGGTEALRKALKAKPWYHHG